MKMEKDLKLKQLKPSICFFVSMTPMNVFMQVPV